MSIARYFETMDYGPAPEADTEARDWLKRHEGRFGHFIGGTFARLMTSTIGRCHHSFG